MAAAGGLEFFPQFIIVSRFSNFPLTCAALSLAADSKEVNDQEERRLFYVAISRARDRLTICSRPGRGKDPTPAGFLRPLLQNEALAPILWTRNTAKREKDAVTLDDVSGIGTWLLLPPAFKAGELKLSANAVDSYSTCPLKFKLERDWKIPGEVAAAMQYGNAVHTVLKYYYDPAAGTLHTAEDVIAAFKTEFAKAVIDDPVQRNLYETQGVKHLQTLLAAHPRNSVDVIATEASFRFNIGSLTVVGRIDRLDRLHGNAVRVVDYKTGAAKTQKAADESLQLSIYAMGAQQMGLAPQELVFLNVKNNEAVVTARTGRS